MHHLGAKTVVLWCVAAFAAGGCGELIGPPRDQRVPVVQALLVAGQDTQSLWVEWSTPADSTYRPSPRPLDSISVNLRLVAPDGAATPFLPSAATPGRFVARVQVRGGLTYRLAGTAGDSTVRAETTVPAPLRILLPAADTVRLRSGDSVPIVWGHNGAASFAVRRSDVPRAGYGADTSGVMRSCSGTTCVWTVLALDPAAAAFLAFDVSLLGARPRRGNVQGGLGFFGSSTADWRVVVWQP